MKTIREHLQEITNSRKGLHFITKSTLEACEGSAKQGSDFRNCTFSVKYKERVIEELIIICKLDVEITMENDYEVTIEVSWS